MFLELRKKESSGRFDLFQDIIIVPNPLTILVQPKNLDKNTGTYLLQITVNQRVLNGSEFVEGSEIAFEMFTASHSTMSFCLQLKHAKSKYETPLVDGPLLY